MKNYIIPFILQETYTLNDFYTFIQKKYNNELEIKNLKLELNILIKKNEFFYNKKLDLYQLTDEGKVILNDNKNYFSRIITRFFKKYSKVHKKYQLAEIRHEQQILRNYLINDKSHKCFLCDKKLPLCLLETAHLKPRCLLNSIEKLDFNIVEFMCRYCHTLYDNGLLSVNNNLLCISSFLTNNNNNNNNNYDLDLIYYENKEINCNLKNLKYFNYHYKTIFRL